MSVVIKTLTPFTEQDVLISALEALDVSVEVSNDVLITDRHDYQGSQNFIWDGSIYRLAHDSDELMGKVIGHSFGKSYTKVKQFLSNLDVQYKEAHKLKLERIEQEERERLEQERLDRVELARSRAVEKAISQGYQVDQKRINGKIKLVLTRTVY